MNFKNKEKSGDMDKYPLYPGGFYGVTDIPIMALEQVNNPKHYTSHPSGIECLTITRHMNFNLGNAFKYIWRSSLKGKRIEDLKKAKFYIIDEINRLEKEQQNGK